MTIDEELIIDEEAIKFREENMSHDSAEVYFPRRGDSSDNYKHIFLSVYHEGSGPTGEDFVYMTELKLAKTAIEKGCKHATDLDYSQLNPEYRSLVLLAAGWKPKT